MATAHRGPPSGGRIYTNNLGADRGAGHRRDPTSERDGTRLISGCAGCSQDAFADARVDGPADVAEALSPRTLAQIGRDLVRVGESLHVIRYMGGRLRLLPASTWYWEGGADPADWLCTATVYGPSGSSTWRLPQSSVVFMPWGASDRKTLPRAITFKLGGRYDAAHGKHRAIPGKRSRRAGCPTVAGSHRTAATAPRKARTRLAGSNPISKTRRAARCWSKPQAADGARALSTRRAPTGSNNASGRCRQMRWSSSAESAFGRSLAAAGCSPALFNDAFQTARRSARRCATVAFGRCAAACPDAVAPSCRMKFGTPGVRLKFDNYGARIWLTSRDRVLPSFRGGRRRSLQEMALALAQIGDGNDD